MSLRTKTHLLRSTRSRVSGTATSYSCSAWRRRSVHDPSRSRHHRRPTKQHRDAARCNYNGPNASFFACAAFLQCPAAPQSCSACNAIMRNGRCRRMSVHQSAARRAQEGANFVGGAGSLCTGVGCVRASPPLRQVQKLAVVAPTRRRTALSGIGIRLALVPESQAQLWCNDAANCLANSAALFTHRGPAPAASWAVDGLPGRLGHALRHAAERGQRDGCHRRVRQAIHRAAIPGGLLLRPRRRLHRRQLLEGCAAVAALGDIAVAAIRGVALDVGTPYVSMSCQC